MDPESAAVKVNIAKAGAIGANMAARPRCRWAVAASTTGGGAIAVCLGATTDVNRVVAKQGKLKDRLGRKLRDGLHGARQSVELPAALDEVLARGKPGGLRDRGAIRPSSKRGQSNW